MANYTLPLPNKQPESDFYWEKAQAHELWLRKCNQCGNAYFYPRNICPNCYSDDVTWIQASGKATKKQTNVAAPLIVTVQAKSDENFTGVCTTTRRNWTTDQSRAASVDGPGPIAPAL